MKIAKMVKKFNKKLNKIYNELFPDADGRIYILTGSVEIDVSVVKFDSLTTEEIEAISKAKELLDNEYTLICQEVAKRGANCRNKASIEIDIEYGYFLDLHIQIK